MRMIKSFLAVLLCSTITVAQADTIAIIGTGNVGSALGPEFAAQGHTIVYGSRNPNDRDVAELVERTGNGASATTQADAVAAADIVVLAVPGTLVAEITAKLGDLSRKLIIDPTNPIKLDLLRMRHVAATSNVDVIQSIAPAADVVKAFNTLGWKVMIDPDIAGGPVSVPLAGDSGRAKRKVADLVRGMGLEPIDVGDSDNARWLEGMAILLINNNILTPRPNFNFYLREMD
ncbi:MAG: NAD(P)-binding domain-containing protein [Gammaproteobacteria bacterium]|nr:NAD(P)-binding domain-containing protein [Gammaproteobacteria bacterium]MDH3375033.1 NAD(P)-binding domain-containing protein [Gammaproteobacteria bacterium]MDH3553563.1 NAD(P)-binding domain-containing protein [Gammaproteobacteria bacterium]